MWCWNPKRIKTLTLPQLLALSPSDVVKFINSLKVPALQKPILETIVPEIEERLNFMEKVGLGYLSLDRETSSLSGGEALKEFDSQVN